MSSNHLELEKLGILSPTIVPGKYGWLSDDAKVFLVNILLCGEEGMHRRMVAKLTKKTPDLVFQLEANSLVYWDTDKFGKQSYLVLTLRGEDLAKLLRVIAKNESIKASKKRISPES